MAKECPTQLQASEQFGEVRGCLEWTWELHLCLIPSEGLTHTFKNVDEQLEDLIEHIETIAYSTKIINKHKYIYNIIYQFFPL